MGTVAVGNLSPDWNLQVCLPHTMNVVVQWRIQGGAPVRDPPPLTEQHFLNFMQFSETWVKIICWCSPLEGLRLLLGKSWIRPFTMHKEFYLDEFFYVLTDLKSVQCEHVLPSGFESESVPEFVSGDVNKPLGYLYSERNF